MESKDVKGPIRKFAVWLLEDEDTPLTDKRKADVGMASSPEDALRTAAVMAQDRNMDIENYHRAVIVEEGVASWSVEIDGYEIKDGRVVKVLVKDFDKKKDWEDPFEIIKELATDGGVMRFGLQKDLFLKLEPKDKVSIEMLEYIIDRHPEITFGELTEQLQNGIWWIYMVSLLSYQSECLDRVEDAEKNNPGALLDVKKFIARIRGNLP